MRDTPSIVKRARRQKLNQDIEAFLAAGGKVQHLPPEASGNPENPFYQDMKAAARKGGRRKSSVTRNTKQRNWASQRMV